MHISKHLIGRTAHIHHCRTCHVPLAAGAAGKFCSEQCRTQWHQLFTTPERAEARPSAS